MMSVKEEAHKKKEESIGSYLGIFAGNRLRRRVLKENAFRKHGSIEASGLPFLSFL